MNIFQPILSGTINIKPTTKLKENVLWTRRNWKPNGNVKKEKRMKRRKQKSVFISPLASTGLSVLIRMKLGIEYNNQKIVRFSMIGDGGVNAISFYIILHILLIFFEYYEMMLLSECIFSSWNWENTKKNKIKWSYNKKKTKTRTAIALSSIEKCFIFKYGKK